MDVRLISTTGVESYPDDELPKLLAREDGLVWVDIPNCHADDARVLSDVFGFHPLAVQNCIERNPVPKVHVYPDHLFVVLHTPEQGNAGHVHYVELDQFVGVRYLVTVHGPLNPAVEPQNALRQTEAVLRRIESGRFQPETPHALSYAIVTAMSGRLREYLTTLTAAVWKLEQRVTAGDSGNPEQLLEDLFGNRHGLLAIRTMATLSREVFGRMITIHAYGTDDRQRLLEDVLDQFSRIANTADGQREYLQGVIEFYQTRNNTKMAIAAERLAVIAAVTLPITAVSSVLGVNLIVNSATDPVLLTVMLVLMVLMSVVLLVWTKRKGWW